MDALRISILEKKLEEENALLLIKLHPTEKLKKFKTQSPNIEFMSSDADIYACLEEVDVIITDYSSVFYDFLFLKNDKFIMFPFDYDEYIKNSRDLIDDYYSNVSRNVAQTLDELFEFMFTSKNLDDSKHLNELKNKFWYQASIGCDHIFQKIQEKI